MNVGVYGTKDEDIILPTVWATLGEIKLGTEPGESAQPPTPSIYEQLLSKFGDLDSLSTEDKSSLVGAINEIYASGGSGTGNVSSSDITQIRVLSREEYNALNPPDSKTEYLILG